MPEETKRATSHFNTTSSEEKKVDGGIPLDDLSALRDIPESLRWLTTYQMLIRVTMIAMQNSFHIVELVERLAKAGVINLEEFEESGLERGRNAIEQLMRMADDLELEGFREARDIHLKEEAARRAAEGK
jgi:hypothetical protein